MNFIEKFKQGKAGKNKGLPMQLPGVDKAMGGVHRKCVYCIAAPPKVGKSKFTDAHFIIYPYLYAIKNNIDIEWVYFSYEMDRVTKEFNFATFFLWHDRQIDTYTYKGQIRGISADYLMGKELDPETFEPIIVDHSIEEALKGIYVKRIMPLFGEYDENGKKLQRGVIDFQEVRKTPTGMDKYIRNYAAKIGSFQTEKLNVPNSKGGYMVEENVTGFKMNNADAYRIIVTDHVRKISPEQKHQGNKKLIADDWLDKTVVLRNLTGFTFVNIIHTNRSLSSTDRIKHNSEFLYPTGDDVKETGNASEDVDYMFTLFNPTDEKYSIKKHFGLELYDDRSNLLYPRYRSLHLVESRHGPCPLHFQLEIVGNTNYFKPLTAGYGF